VELNFAIGKLKEGVEDDCEPKTTDLHLFASPRNKSEKKTFFNDIYMWLKIHFLKLVLFIILGNIKISIICL
jgi:hypothetical protein